MLRVILHTSQWKQPLCQFWKTKACFISTHALLYTLHNTYCMSVSSLYWLFKMVSCCKAVHVTFHVCVKLCVFVALLLYIVTHNVLNDRIPFKGYLEVQWHFHGIYVAWMNSRLIYNIVCLMCVEWVKLQQQTQTSRVCYKLDKHHKIQRFSHGFNLKCF